jgi:hypothetical protein
LHDGFTLGLLELFLNNVALMLNRSDRRWTILLQKIGNLWYSVKMFIYFTQRRFVRISSNLPAVFVFLIAVGSAGALARRLVEVGVVVGTKVLRDFRLLRYVSSLVSSTADMLRY